MKLRIYIKLLHKSMIRNKTVMIVLALQMAISVMLVSVIFSFLSGGFHTIREQGERERETTTIMLMQPVPLSTLTKLEMEWREKSKVRRFSYLASTEDQVKFGSSVVILPIFGINKDYSFFFGFPFEELREGEVVLTVNAAKKLFPNRSTESVTGEIIQFNNKTYTVIGVEQKSLVDRVYIPYADFQQAYEKIDGVVVGSLAIDKDSVQIVLEELKPYSPIEQVVKSQYKSFMIFLIIASLITIFLVFYSVLSFIQLYSFKLIKERDKWNILFMLGATRGNLRSYLYTETGCLTILSLMAAAFGYWGIVHVVSVEGLTFQIDVVVILSITTIVITMILISVELTLHKLRRNVFK